MNIAIYARVSTQNQAKEGTINSQLDALRSYANDHELSIIQECIDNGISGSTLERPGLDELRDLTLSGEIEGVLILSPDRLSRKQAHQIILMEEFQKQNVKVIFTTQQFDDTPEGNLMLQIQGAVAEFERAKIRDRMRRGMKHAVKNGQIIAGKTPFGYKLVRKTNISKAKWEIDEGEAEIVRKIYDLYVNHGMKGTDIARYLDEKGIPTRKAAKWWPAVIYAILKNESYVGKAYMYKYKWIKPKRRSKINNRAVTSKNSRKPAPTNDRICIPIPQLIDKPTWEATQALLKKNARKSRRNNRVNNYLLRGLVVCGECGSMCSGYVSNKKTYYSCGAKRNKNITTMPHDDVRIATRQKSFDALIWQGLTELLSDPTNLQKQMEKRIPQVSKKYNAIKNTCNNFEKELSNLDIQEKRIIDAYRESIIDIDELREQKTKIANNRTSLKAQLKSSQSDLESPGQQDITIKTLGDISARFHNVMEKADFSTREKLVNLLVDSVVLYENKASVKGFIPTSNLDALTTPHFYHAF